MGQDIYIIDDNIEFMNILTELFKNDKEYKLKNIKTQDIDLALKDIPSLIIINEEGIKTY